jgi:NADP-dependent 3-hydroxy acid dehydrogenase YdfG
VLATVRSASKGTYLREVPGIEVLTLDVSDAASVATLAAELQLRGGRLDVLVNNAGRGLAGPLLEADLDAAKKLYDTNVWGLLAVTQACAPFVIAAQGTVVNMSSVGAIVPLPWIGAS